MESRLITRFAATLRPLAWGATMPGLTAEFNKFQQAVFNLNQTIEREESTYKIMDKSRLIDRLSYLKNQIEEEDSTAKKALEKYQLQLVDIDNRVNLLHQQINETIQTGTLSKETTFVDSTQLESEIIDDKQDIELDIDEESCWRHLFCCSAPKIKDSEHDIALLKDKRNKIISQDKTKLIENHVNKLTNQRITLLELQAKLEKNPPHQANGKLKAFYQQTEAEIELNEDAQLATVSSETMLRILDVYTALIDIQKKLQDSPTKDSFDKAIPNITKMMHLLKCRDDNYRSAWVSFTLKSEPLSPVISSKATEFKRLTT